MPKVAYLCASVENNVSVWLFVSTSGVCGKRGAMIQQHRIAPQISLSGISVNDVLILSPPLSSGTLPGVS